MQRFAKNGSDISGEMLIGGLRMFQIMGGAFQGDGFGPKKSSEGCCKENVLAATDSHHGAMGNMSNLGSVLAGPHNHNCCTGRTVYNTSGRVCKIEFMIDRLFWQANETTADSVL